MLNLTNMNLSRLFKTKVFYVTIVILFALHLLISKGEVHVVNNSEEIQQAIDEKEDFSAEDMDEIMEDIAEDTHATFDEAVKGQLGSGMLFMMVGIFAAVYSDEERKSGFLKNLNQKKGKPMIFLSKIPVILTFSAIAVLVSFLAIKLGFIGSGYAIVNALDIIRFMAYEVLYVTAFGIGIMALYEMVRGSVLPIILTIIFAGNLQGQILQFIEVKLAGLSDFFVNIFSKFDLSQNLIVSKAGQLQAGAGFSYTSGLIVGLIGLVVYSIIGMTVFADRDTY